MKWKKKMYLYWRLHSVLVTVGNLCNNSYDVNLKCSSLIFVRGARGGGRGNVFDNDIIHNNIVYINISDSQIMSCSPLWGRRTVTDKLLFLIIIIILIRSGGQVRYHRIEKKLKILICLTFILLLKI